MYRLASSTIESNIRRRLFAVPHNAAAIIRIQKSMREADASEVHMVAIINLTAELAKLKTLKGLTPTTPLAEGVGFAQLAPFRDSAIFAIKSSGKTAWERHPGADELVQIVEGTAILDIAVDDGPPQSFEVSAGMVAIVPKGKWHRVSFPDDTTLVTVTPGQTEFVQRDVDDPRTV
jgi:mannose-6-phosphate isomerase-like protein (cupin superfamily)